MKLYLPDYLFDGLHLRRDTAVLMKDDSVLDVGNFKELEKSYPDVKKVELPGGVLFPGFVNLHTHLELGYLKGKLPQGVGFTRWLKEVMKLKMDQPAEEEVLRGIEDGIKELKNSGVAVVGDISNTLLSVDVLAKYMPKSTVFFENYSLNRERAYKKIEELKNFRSDFPLKVSLTPHSVYSSHPCLMEFLCKKSSMMSIHFLESEEERLFFDKRGGLYSLVRDIGLLDYDLNFKDHWDFLRCSGCLKERTIFVHCVFADKEDLKKIKDLDGTVCLCLRSNQYITQKMPDVYKMVDFGLNIGIGTDSLASNWDLNFLNELKFIKEKFPLLKAEEIFKWASFGGAKALGIKWGFLKGYKAKPVFIVSDSVNPLEDMLEKGAKAPVVNV